MAPLTHDTTPVPGRRYARLVIVEELPRSRTGERMVLTRCDCGHLKKMFWQNVKSGKSRSCGCAISEATRRRCTVKNVILPAPLTEVAWAAGFFDGEGNVSVTNKRLNSRTIMVQIGQVDREVLDRFKAAVGGVGNVNGPYDRTRSSGNPNHRPYFQYSCSNKDGVQHIIDTLWPYLSSPKREQIEHCIDVVRG